jgi:hypothetical protein
MARNFYKYLLQWHDITSYATGLPALPNVTLAQRSTSSWKTSYLHFSTTVSTLDNCVIFDGFKLGIEIEIVFE